MQEAKLDKSFVVAAAQDRVFEALTHSAHLRAWFAEHAEVEPRVGGRFAFWGVLTPWTPREAATQRVTIFEPGEKLAFTWNWRACESDVALTLEPNARGTTLRVLHTGRGAVLETRENTEFAMLDFWRFAVGNLRSYLKTGRAALRPRFENQGVEVSMSIDIDAPASVVYAALTDPKQMDKWISTAATVDAKPGGTYNYGWNFGDPPAHCGPRKILAIEPGRVIEHDWDHAKEPTTRVRWEIAEIGPGKTRVKLTHRRPAEDDSTRGGYLAGWSAFLLMLKQYGEEPHATDLR